MDESPQHFPDVDEFVWLVESGQTSQPWGRWRPPPGGPRGGLAPCPFEADPAVVARQALDDWFAEATATVGDLDAEDLWLRASVWRLGRVVDGGLIRATPSEAPDLSSYGRLLYRSGIAPDAVEVRTPYQVVRAADVARRTAPLE